MKISRKAYYGLRAMLALSQESGPISGRDLSQKENIPEEYLEKILQELRKAGFIVSFKGVSGGYTLAPECPVVNAWEVITALDGPLKIYAPTNEGSLPCFQPSHCQTNLIFRKIEENLKSTLQEIPLSSLNK